MSRQLFLYQIVWLASKPLPSLIEKVNQYIVDYYQEKYPNSAVYKINLFGLFVEKGEILLKDNGNFSMIIPNLFFGLISKNLLLYALIIMKIMKY